MGGLVAKIEITRGEKIILELIKAQPRKFRVLFPLLTSDKAKLLALSIRKKARER